MGASTRKMAARRTNMGMMIGTWEEKRGIACRGLRGPTAESEIYACIDADCLKMCFIWLTYMFGMNMRCISGCI